MCIKKVSVILMVGLLAVLLLAGCAGNAPRTIPTTDASGTDMVDVEDDDEIVEGQTGIRSWPKDIPEDVPKFEKGEITNGSIGTGKFMMMFDQITNVDVTEYIAALEVAGYNKSSEQEISGGSLVEMNNGFFEITINHSKDTMILDIVSLDD